MELSVDRQQQDILIPQAIPLRSRDSHGQLIKGAPEAMKKWRKLIFEAQGNSKDFWLVNAEGKQYKAQLKYVLCSERALQRIIKDRWYHPHTSQKDLVTLLETHPEKFNVCIIQKTTGGKSFMMLHCAPKAA
jgi:hypothetical protein